MPHIRWAPLRRTHIPRGCDQQGRYPEAAEAATELGADAPNEPAWWYPVVVDTALALCVVVALYLILVAVL